MKKQKITLLILLIILVGLIIALVYFNGKVPTEEILTDDTSNQNTVVLENDFDTLTSLEINNETGNYVYTATKNEDTSSVLWESQYKNLTLDESNLTGLGRQLSSFTTSNKIENGDFDEYGIDKNTYVTANFSDGTKNTMYIGNTTPDNSYYYVSVNDDPNIYYTSYVTGNKFFSQLNDFVLKTLPTIAIDQITDFQVTDVEGNDFHVAYVDEEAPIDQYQTYGAISLQMVAPYEGYSIYSEKLSEQVFSNIENLKFGNLVEADATDLSQYGLDNPELTIKIQTINMDGYNLLIGNEFTLDDTPYFYSKLENSSSVFLMEQSLVKPFLNIDGFNMMERFINLENIDGVNNVEINIYGQDYLLEMNHETTGEGEDEKLTLSPTINGKSIEEDAFKDIYQAVIAISYDNPVDTISPSMLGEKVLKITYNNEDGTSTYTDYYKYNDNFLGVSEDGKDVEFVTNTNDIEYLKTNLETTMSNLE